MPIVSTWLNKDTLEKTEQIATILNETLYDYLQKAIKQRNEREQSLMMKAQRWLMTDHPILKKDQR